MGTRSPWLLHALVQFLRRCLDEELKIGVAVHGASQLPVANQSFRIAVISRRLHIAAVSGT
jgi:hypothetical protein